MIASTDDIVSIDFMNPKNHLHHDEVSVESSVLHGRFLDVIDKVKHKFSSVECFCQKYSSLLKFTPTIMNSVQEEFIEHQLLD